MKLNLLLIFSLRLSLFCVRNPFLSRVLCAFYVVKTIVFVFFIRGSFLGLLRGAPKETGPVRDRSRPGALDTVASMIRTGFVEYNPNSRLRRAIRGGAARSHWQDEEN